MAIATAGRPARPLGRYSIANANFQYCISADDGCMRGFSQSATNGRDC